MSFSYVRSDESFMFGSVAGTVDDTYEADWLVNGSPGRPAVGSAGFALTVTALAARQVNYVAIVNHNLVGSVAISGGVTASIPAATVNADGIPLNSGVAIPVVTASSLVVTVAESPSIIGELVAGRLRTLERQLLVDPDFTPSEPFEWLGEFSSIPPYDPGLDGRRLSGETLVTKAGLDEIQAWYQSTRRGTRPTLILPVDRVNDPWLVTFQYSWQPHIEGKSGVHVGIYRVRFQFREIPLVRWPA